jgi:site-specific recombinase XerD
MLHTLLPEKQIQGNPLESHLRTFATSLVESGYRKQTIEEKLYLLSALGWWLGRSKRPVSQLDEHVADTFAKHKRRLHWHRLRLATLQQFIDHLRKLNIIPHRKQALDSSPLTETLNAYGQYLRSERGLIPGTIREYQSYARKFLVARFRGRPLVLKTLKASDISNFVLQHCRTLSIKRAQLMTTAFRSFFRYLFQKGDIGTNLAFSVPGVPDWGQATVPKYLIPKEVQRVLRACNRRTPKGRRDYAILLLLARLGLRAGEVVSLQLEDIDWRAGEILVRGKGLRHERMPLPNDVGKALASYLRRDRPACPTRRVFVCMNAPHRGFAACATLPTIVRCAIERANLHPPSKGAHLFRHSLATSMLRSGATMGEIGEVLRHRSLATTDIYAKVDFDGLRSLAHSWPAGDEQ